MGSKTMAIVKKLLIIPPIIIAVLVFIYMKGQKPAPQVIESTEIARQVRVIEAREVSVVPRIHGFGAVTPGRQWLAIAQVSGEIIKVFPDLKKGAIIKAQTVLVTLSPADFELAIAQANANLRATDAKIAELNINRQNTLALLDIEKQSLKIRQGELARQEELFKNGTVSRTAFDREKRDTFVQRKKVQDLENALRLIPTQLVVQKEQREVFRAQLQSAQLNLQRTKISLPFDARISEVDAQVAQFAQAGKVLARADGVASAEIEAQIPIEQFMDLLKAATGDKKVTGIDNKTLNAMTEKLAIKVQIVLNTNDRPIRWTARLARISDIIDPKTRTIGVIAVVEGSYAQAVPGQRPPLTKGMFVEMEISARALGKKLIVPRLALNGTQLFIAGRDNRLEIRTVETGLVQDDFVVIASGLSKGERVIVSDLSPMINDMLLAVETDIALSNQIVGQAIGGAR